MKEQVVLLQRNAEKDKELLHCKDKELHHQRRPSPEPSHSRGDERGVGDMNKKRDRRSPHYYGEREKTPPGRELFLHLLARAEERSKKGIGLKDQPFILESIQHCMFLVRMP